MAPTTLPAPDNAQDRIRRFLIDYGRTGTSWSLLLGMTRQAFSDRLTGRTRFTLADAIRIASITGVSLDALVAWDDDLPIGYTPTTEEELPEGAPLEEHPRAFTASVSPMHLPHRCPTPGPQS